MTTPNARSAALVSAFAAIYVIWGSTYLAIRYEVDTLPPFLMAGIRSLAAGTALFALSTRGRSDSLRVTRWRSAAVAGGLLFLAGHGLLSWAEQRVLSGIAALVLATIPMWIVVLGWIPRGRAADLKTSGAIGLGVLGVVILVCPWQSDGAGLDEWKPLSALLASSFLWACGSLYARSPSLPSRLGLSAAMQLMTGGALLLIVGVSAGEMHRLDPSQVSLRSLISVLYLIVFGSLIAFSAYCRLLRRVEPALVGT